MKKLALVLSISFAFSSSFALSLDEVVDKAFKNNQDINSIKQSLEILDKDIKLSRKWNNPILSLGVNDIHFNEPFKRDIEAMQAQYIGISQVIPMGNKLEIKEELAKKDKRIIALLLEDEKLKLKSKIYEFSYKILILEKKLKLLNSYSKNIKKLEKLSSSLYGYGNTNQNEILSAKIAYTNLEIKKQDLKNMINNLYLKSEAISSTKIEAITAPLDMKKLVLNMDIEYDINTHPKIKIQKLKSKKFDDLAKLEKEKEISDIKVNIAYFNRNNRFEDYANISVNIPLSIYKSEKVKSIQAKLKAKQIDTKLLDIKKDFNTKISILENNINNAYKNYTLIKNSIIPLKRKIQKNIENYNSLKGLKPQVAIKNMNELISFEINAINQINEYYKNYSKSKYYMKKAR